MRKICWFIALGVTVLALGAVKAQTPEPVVVQAASAAPQDPAASRPAASNVVAGSKDTLQLLQEMRATNDATIKKQEAALENLDALQKAAEELKIFSKRG